MKEDSPALFPRKGQEKQFSEEEIGKAVQVVRSLAARTMRGEQRAAPLALYEAIQAFTPQPFVEVILTDGKGRYALHRRPKNEKHFGPNRLHILGGALRPDRHGITPVKAARAMAKDEMGAQDIKYLAGPIATYQWKPVIEHPTGWPNSQVYVFKVVGDLPERDDIVWFKNNTLPSQDEIITDRSGEIHLDFLRVYQNWCENPRQPCRDLNEKPLNPEKLD